MSVHRFCITLENPAAVYFPGQMVSGKVDFWISKRKKIRGIKLEAKGESIVHWTETVTRTGRSDNSQRQTMENKSYYSAEKYFQHSFALLQRGGETFDLVPGNYEYLFRFQLPNELPSSFEGGYGWVRYTLKVTVERPWKSNYEVRVPITVNTVVDLNTIEMAEHGIQGMDTKSLNCVCCSSGPITVKTWLDHIGYVPGQKLLFCAEIENKSRRTLTGSKVQLIQYCTFHAEGSTKSLSRVLYKEKRGRIGQTESWSRAPIPIPAVVPSMLRFCNHITVQYRILFTVKTDQFSPHIRIQMNIIIGNIPLRTFFSDFSMPSAPPPEIPISSAPPLDTKQYPDLPPPSYEETMFAANIREEGDSEYINYGGSMEFAPRYLTYTAVESS